MSGLDTWYSPLSIFPKEDSVVGTNVKNVLFFQNGRKEIKIWKKINNQYICFKLII